MKLLINKLIIELYNFSYVELKLNIIDLFQWRCQNFFLIEIVSDNLGLKSRHYSFNGVFTRFIDDYLFIFEIENFDTFLPVSKDSGLLMSNNLVSCIPSL